MPKKYNFIKTSEHVQDLHGFLWTSGEDGAQVRNAAINCVTTAADVTEIRG